MDPEILRSLPLRTLLHYDVTSDRQKYDHCSTRIETGTIKLSQDANPQNERERKPLYTYNKNDAIRYLIKCLG